MFSDEMPDGLVNPLGIIVSKVSGSSATIPVTDFMSNQKSYCNGIPDWIEPAFVWVYADLKSVTVTDISELVAYIIANIETRDIIIVGTKYKHQIEPTITALVTGVLLFKHGTKSAKEWNPIDGIKKDCEENFLSVDVPHMKRILRQSGITEYDVSDPNDDTVLNKAVFPVDGMVTCAICNNRVLEPNALPRVFRKKNQGWMMDWTCDTCVTDPEFQFRCMIVEQTTANSEYVTKCNKIISGNEVSIHYNSGVAQCQKHEKKSSQQSNQGSLTK